MKLFNCISYIAADEMNISWMACRWGLLWGSQLKQEETDEGDRSGEQRMWTELDW